MNREWSEEDLKVLAKNLRKPEGEVGLEVAKRMNEGNAPMNLHTLAVLNPKSNQHILEVGMGNGFFVKNILELDKTIRYFGLDYSADMVEQAQFINRKYIDQGRAVFKQESVENLSFEAEWFDQVFSINTLYFWKDVESTLSSLKSVLKKGGRLVLAIRPKHNMLTLPVTKYDFKLFEKDEVINTLGSADFSNIQVTEVTEPPQTDSGMSGERKCIIFSATKS